jgi:hypothetical protein
MTFLLEDCEALNAQHPDSFEIPSITERLTLKPGQHAKVMAVSPEGVERIWVQITERLNGLYIGTLANQPIYMGLDHGAPITFEPRHVMDVLPEQ